MTPDEPDDVDRLVDEQLARGEPLGCHACGSLWIGADDECWHCPPKKRLS